MAHLFTLRFCVTRGSPAPRWRAPPWIRGTGPARGPPTAARPWWGVGGRPRGSPAGKTVGTRMARRIRLVRRCAVRHDSCTAVVTMTGEPVRV
ncbi:hypothetical protein SLI_7333 [Streptomyces lividans 1326]|uniref:Uncharacterized protein n=1 Tax=Streptomyces lividans 1326 TaxID=1200984 RepID=A0A7U9DZP9_STRLI|nr:hypothetical protein SLI_7333 [Streptomyces lividans 1326]